jgi:hypothetical protein
VKEFRDGRKIDLIVYTKVELYPILLLGGGDTEWVSCAIGKENMAGQHCYHYQRSTKDFIQGLGQPWTIEKIKTSAGQHQNRLLLPHLQTSFWHCNMLLRNCDIDMTFYPRIFECFPELCHLCQKYVQFRRIQAMRMSQHAISRS